ncbi:MAG: alpha/beta fold hydrolase [Firmicutes bacterium]|nr:alpha/beta fold hydrolase [Bacillota bacterium]
MIDLDMMYKDSNWGNDPKGPDNITILMPGGRGWFNALLCHAGIDKKRPAVLLLHGFPGNDKNLDMMEALRRCGFNVLTMNYSGSWGSPGPFLFANVLEDAATALKFLQDNADEYMIDKDNIFVIGHSMGGFATLHTTAACEGIKGSVAFAPYDFGLQYKLGIENGGDDWTNVHELVRDGVQQLDTDYDTLMDELRDNPGYQFEAIADKLAKKPLLVIEAGYDICAASSEKNHSRYLAEWIEANDPVDFELDSIPSNHSFADTRLALCEMVAKKLASWVD